MTFCGGAERPATKTGKTRGPRRVKHEDACLLRRTERTAAAWIIKKHPGIREASWTDHLDEGGTAENGPQAVSTS